MSDNGDEIKKGAIKVLFIGNSHTYVNDMPALFSHIFEKTTEVKVDSVMLAYSGRKLDWHLKEYMALRYNLMYGKYDYCVIQQAAHPFPPEKETINDGKRIIDLCKKYYTTPVLYMTWAEKKYPENQQKMIDTYTNLAEKTGALLAPIGIQWRNIQNKYPEVELYYKDGEHPSPYGDLLIAASLVKTISKKNPSFPNFILDNKVIFVGDMVEAEENIDIIRITYDETIAKKIYSCL